MGLLNVVVVAGIVVTILTGIPVLRQMRSHPRGLIILFFAEMWERFSYYGMRALLIFYLTQHFLFSDDEASGLYGSYTSLVYLLPLVAACWPTGTSARARPSRSAPFCWSPATG
jgi:POT family proton-dependent oligopeptide transporter